MLKRIVHNQQPSMDGLLAWRAFRGCTRKKVYLTESAAKRAIRSIRRNGTDTNPRRLLNAYHCDRCNQWHVGHSNRIVGDSYTATSEPSTSAHQ